MTRAQLGEFEQLLLLAVLRLGDEAWAEPILDELRIQTGRVASPGSMYVTLDRLETKGFLRSRVADVRADRGGRPRRYVTVTAKGLRALRASRDALMNLWRGLEGTLGET
jgi:DNA-binding PadR family transcriptional regulator